MKQLDDILKLLQDSNWNDYLLIKDSLAFSNNEFHDAIIFLKNQQMIELNKNNIRITSKGTKFSELPH